jgi:hypothetical protein
VTKTLVRPLPEMLTRSDVSSGEWSVQGCEPTRGVPHTVIGKKQLVAPQGIDPLSTAVRAHEMVHAKVSPQDLTPWLERGHASQESLTACEEARVNYLAKKAGFTMSVLFDGSEKSTGERLVAMNDWDGAVRMAIATLGSDAHKHFIAGVKRHNVVWAKVLADIGKRAMRELVKHDRRGVLSAIDPVRSRYYDDTTEPLSPSGFQYTEMLAKWVDQLCENNPTDDDDDSESGDDESGDGGKSGGNESGDGDNTMKPTRKRSDDGEATKKVLESRKVKPAERPIPAWCEMVLETCPMPIVLNGSMGRKRIASNTGKSPRRLNRYLTDPQKRVFDHTIRGKGGIVVIDCSGSTRITSDEVRQILLNSPSATVVAYTVLSFQRDENGNLPPNAWVLATKGRMVEEMPFETGSANAVDLPVMRWAVDSRKRREPIVWVTDGGVSGWHDEFHESLNLEALEFVKRHGIIVAKDVNSAIDKLTKLQQGTRPTSDYGFGFQPFVEAVFG